VAAHLLPAFGAEPIEAITADVIERWRRSLTGLSNRSKNKLLIQLHGIFRRAQMVWGLPVNPLARVEKHPMRPSGDIQVFSPEEVWAMATSRSFLVCLETTAADARVSTVERYAGSLGCVVQYHLVPFD
jgi:hypothetical protein